MCASITFYNGTGADLKIQTSSGKSIATFPATDDFTGDNYTINDKYILNGESLKSLIGGRSYLNIDFQSNLIVKNPVSQSTFGANNTTVQAAHGDNTWMLIISMKDKKCVSCTTENGWVEQKYSDFISGDSSISIIWIIVIVLVIILAIVVAIYFVKKKNRAY